MIQPADVPLQHPEKRRWLLWAAGLAVLFVPVATHGVPVAAQTYPLEIDDIFSWSGPESPGCALEVTLPDGATISRQYGLADLDRGAAITAETVFDVGSVQKQFVAALVLMLVEQGKLALEDDVRRFFPELNRHAAAITVDHLLTHTSGIRDWTLLELLPGNTGDILGMILAEESLDFVPGEKWAYSNSNYVLLKHLVQQLTGKSLSDFARERLFEPLGMTRSSFVHDLNAPIENRALAYEWQNGRWSLEMRLEDDRGGGVLFATARDLSIWNEALNSGRLGSFVTGKLQEPAKLNDGTTLDYARGLMIERRDGTPRLFWHSGGAGGYSGIAGRFLKEGIVLVLLCNAGEGGDVQMLSRQVFSMLVPSDNDLLSQ